MPFIQTYTGRRVDFTNPSPGDICIEDIAHSLSRLCRFNGHVDFLSVAEHSLHVYEQVNAEFQRHALLHDAAEAYLGDIPKPIKRAGGLDKWFEWEALMEAAIFAHFGLVPKIPKVVKDADARMTLTEGEQILGSTEGWELAELYDPYTADELVSPIESMHRDDAKSEFLIVAQNEGLAKGVA